MTTYQDHDKGWKAILKEIKKLGKMKLEVGVLGNAPRHPSGLNVADIATFNEFGTSSIPARPFIRSTFDENTEKYQRWAQKSVSLIGAGMSANNVAKRMGEMIKSDIQRKIVAIKMPPNSAATIQRKGSSNPLIDTGRMRQSIDYRLTNV